MLNRWILHTPVSASNSSSVTHSENSSAATCFPWTWNELSCWPLMGWTDGGRFINDGDILESAAGSEQSSSATGKGDRSRTWCNADWTWTKRLFIQPQSAASRSLQCRSQKEAKTGTADHRDFLTWPSWGPMSVGKSGDPARRVVLPKCMGLLKSGPDRVGARKARRQLTMNTYEPGHFRFCGQQQAAIARRRYLKSWRSKDELDETSSPSVPSRLAGTAPLVAAKSVATELRWSNLMRETPPMSVHQLGWAMILFWSRFNTPVLLKAKICGK